MSKILITYFSHSGNTKTAANIIKETTGGDLFEIKTTEAYPVEYNDVVSRAKKELNAGHRPALTAKVDNMESYDVIFVGYPNWWSTVPTGVFTFLEAYDFSGKTIVPFCTHEGSGLGKSESDIKKSCPNSTVLEGLSIRGNSVNQAQTSVAAWLNKLGLIK